MRDVVFVLAFLFSWPISATMFQLGLLEGQTRNIDINIALGVSFNSSLLAELLESVFGCLYAAEKNVSNCQKTIAVTNFWRRSEVGTSFTVECWSSRISIRTPISNLFGAKGSHLIDEGLLYQPPITWIKPVRPISVFHNILQGLIRTSFSFH